MLMKTFSLGKSLKAFGPLGLLKIERLGDVSIPALAYQEKPLAPRKSPFKRLPEILHEDDVAIGIAQILVAGDQLRTGEHVVQVLHAGFVPFDMRLIAEAEIGADFSGTFVVPK